MVRERPRLAEKFGPDGTATSLGALLQFGEKHMLNGKGRHCQVIDHVVVDTGKIIVAGRGETDFRKYCETAGAIEPPSDL